MVEITREILAYSIIALIVVVAIPVLIKARIRQSRERLRRRGIKHFDH